MYTVRPKGINTKLNDRNVPDGCLQESINMQWRDGSFRPIPERITSGIEDVSGKDEIILHKVSDEDVVNVLMFDSGVLYWVGAINSGTYSSFSTSITISNFPTVTDFDSLSYQILNNIISLMSDSQFFYYKLEYSEDDGAYEVTNMYEWKDLVPYFPQQGVVSFKYDIDGISTNYTLTRCGCILIRFTLSLDTGEEVLHTTPYMFSLYGFNASSSDINEDDAIRNIHTFINLNLSFIDDDIYEDHISAINVYASVPDYETTFNEDVEEDGIKPIYTKSEMMAQFQEQADEPFYLIKTIDDPSDTDKILLYQNMDISIMKYDDKYLADLDSVFMVKLSTIAAGAVMPVDNYSHHKLFGKISAYNNRLIVQKPITVMSEGYGRSLSTSKTIGMQIGFKASTEDGVVNGVSYSIDTSFSVDSNYMKPRGLLAYPDLSGTYVGFGSYGASKLNLLSLSENESSNMACNYSLYGLTVYEPSLVETTEVVDVNGVDETHKFVVISCQYEVLPIYETGTKSEDISPIVGGVSYDSGNRVQFSKAGEYSVWPVSNSYRVGSGIVMFVGNNSVDPSNSDFLAPLIIGASDGIYTANFDTSGSVLIQSITKTANIPAISKESMQIDQAIIFVSDVGLIAINNGTITNITSEFFPTQGSIGFNSEYNYLANYLASYLVGVSNQDEYYPNYKLLTSAFFGSFNTYTITDIISYMKSAVFAYDARRANLWCCNPNRNFSMVFNTETKQWSTSTYKYTKVIELFNTITTSQGSLYSRYLTLSSDDSLDILSSEDLTTGVNVHILTRPIKMNSVDVFKKVDRIIARCTLYKTTDSYFALGLWGKQDVNKRKVNIPLAAYLDDSEDSFPNDVRQDIPVGSMKGKYKTISVLMAGYVMPDSSFDGFDITASLVDNKTMR